MNYNSGRGIYIILMITVENVVDTEEIKVKSVEMEEIMVNVVDVVEDIMVNVVEMEEKLVNVAKEVMVSVMAIMEEKLGREGIGINEMKDD